MAEKVNGVVSRTELARRVSVRLGDNPMAEETVFAVFEEIARIVAGGGRVTVVNFGTFEPRTAKAWTARNPLTGEPVAVPETVKLKFDATGLAKQMVKDGNSNGTIRGTRNK